jgi:hypothetical protein
MFVCVLNEMILGGYDSKSDEGEKIITIILDLIFNV